jgi:hypothetical protein
LCNDEITIQSFLQAYVKKKVPGTSNLTSIWNALSAELETVPKEAAAVSKKGKRKAGAAVENGDTLNKKMKLNGMFPNLL